MTCLILFMLAAVAQPEVTEIVEVEEVWAGHPVGFALLTEGDRQFVAYYDADRRMTVASRELGSQDWAVKRLPEQVGWDSHNYITLAVDDNGDLHVSGNMHCDPLVYFRTSVPMDVTSLEGATPMVGARERRATYPKFGRTPDGALTFTYRDGSSGNGNQIWNVYDAETHTWSRLLDQPLTDGEGKRNAYLVGPTRGPDGLYHLVWVWRDTGDAATNHDLSYACSPDLVHWRTSAGREMELPLTLDDAEIVDPVPPGGGIINGNTKIGFDHQGRVVLSYHKHDADGHTQIYNARREEAGWRIYQTSDWDFRWDFGGGGSLKWGIRLSGVRKDADGRLYQTFGNKRDGSAAWYLAPETLKAVERRQVPPAYPRELTRPESEWPGMGVRWAHDKGSAPESGVRYVLRWETLGSNRDRERDKAPPPSMLRVYRLEDAKADAPN